MVLLMTGEVGSPYDLGQTLVLTRGALVCVLNET